MCTSQTYHRQLLLYFHIYYICLVSHFSPSISITLSKIYECCYSLATQKTWSVFSVCMKTLVYFLVSV